MTALLLLLLSSCVPKSAALPTDLTMQERQDWQRVILAAERALQDTPLAADAPVWREQMVLGYLQLGLLDSAQSQMQLMLTLCGPDSIWRRVHEGSPLVIERADTLLEVNLRRVTLGWDQFMGWAAEDPERVAWAMEQVRTNCRAYDHYFGSDPRRSQIAGVCDQAWVEP